jgi:hypothetical protein
MALLLFVFIAYGATAEVVHKHGTPGKQRDEATSSIRAANDDGSAARESGQSGACLICQLHQNLFVSLFNAQPKLLPPTALVARPATQPTSYLSQTDAPRRGRAPPFTSQL